MRPPLQILVICSLIARVLQVSRIINLITPNVDYSTMQIGILSIKAIVQISVDHDSATLPEPKLRLLLPFTTATPIQLYYRAVSDECQKIRDPFSTTSTTISGDQAGAYVFTLSSLEFVKQSSIYLFFRLTSLPASVATTTIYTPIGLSLISSSVSQFFITYAYTPNFVNLIQTPQAPVGTIVVNTSPSTTQTNYAEITKVFEALIDITVSIESERISIRHTSTNGYWWAIDAAQTCEIVDPALGLGHISFLGTQYECLFEDEGDSSKNRFGIFLNFKGIKLAAGQIIRLKVKVENPKLPGTASLRIANLDRYGGYVKELTNVASAFTCAGTTFRTGFPIIIYGPDISTAESTYPNLRLFTSGSIANRIIFNSIRINFRTNIDLPEPVDHYYVTIKIGGTARTSIPQAYIYENLTKAKTKDRTIITVDAVTKDITIRNIGELNRLNVYSIGFKVALEGDEVFNWATDFLRMEILDSSGVVIVTSALPQNVNAEAQILHTNAYPLNYNSPTLFHSLPSTAANADFTLISGTNFGLKKDTDQLFFLSANFQQSGGVNTRNYIEIIISSKIRINSNIGFTAANADQNCFVRNNLGASLTGVIQNCYYEIKNNGQANRQYTRLRIGGKTAGFWSTGGNTFYWGFRLAQVNFQNSFFVTDTDSVILDAYINVYTDAGTTDPSIDWSATPSLRYLDNMIALNNNIMNQLRLDFSNYFRSATDQLTGAQVPVFLRVSGILDGVNTVETQKILIFFDDIQPIYLDTNNFEIGCSNSQNFLVRCYHHRALTGGSRTCSGSTCSNPLYRDMLEIHFTSITLAKASAEDIQVIVPITLSQVANRNFNFAVGVATSHSGSFRDYIRLIEYKILATISFPPLASATTVASLQNSAGTINALSSIKPGVVSIDTSVKGKMGESFSSKIDMDCDQTTNLQCRITASGEYYSITMCANWDFMDTGSFNVDNSNNFYNVPSIYTKCVQNIKYLFSGNLKYCFYCSIWSSGSIEDSRNIYGFRVPNYIDNRWPSGTFTALSGRNTQYGLFRLTQMDLITGQAFQPNSISNVRVVPTIWYEQYKSMNIKISMRLTNGLLSGSSIIIRTNLFSPNLPLSFIRSPNPYCYLIKTSGTTSCTSVRTGTDIVVTLTQAISEGDVTLDLYGVEITYSGANVQSTFRIFTTTNLGTAPQFYVDQSETEAFVVRFEDHPSGQINRFILDSIKYGSDDDAALSFFEMGVILGNSKPLYQNDVFKMNMGSAATAVASAPVWCQILNPQGQIITDVTSCSASNLASVQIYSEKATSVNLFVVKFWSYIIPTSYTTVAPVDLTSTLETENGAGTTAVTQTYFGVTSQKLPQINPAVAYANLATFTMTPSLPFFGARPIWSLMISPSAYTIKVADSLVLTFPANTNTHLLDKIHSCIMDGATQYQLFCVMSENRELVINGFESAIPPGSSKTILIDGVEIGSGNLGYFYIKVIDEDQIIRESKSIGTVITPTALTASYAMVYDLKFTNLFIRAQNDIEYKFKTGATAIASGDVIHVWLTYFYYEFMILPLTLTCEANAPGNVVTDCRRIGKRVLMTVSGIASNTEVTVKIKNLITPNYKQCQLMKISQYVTNTGSTVVKYISPSEYLNVDNFETGQDATLIYLNFEGLSSSGFITVSRGSYNQLKIVREDKKRFNDELSFSLTRDYGGQFVKLNPIEFQLKDSFLGELSIPFQLGCQTNSLITVFLLNAQKTERFLANRFAPLPFLIVETSRQKSRLPVPEKIQVFRGYESLPMILLLQDLPVTGISISVAIQSFDSLNQLTLVKPLVVAPAVPPAVLLMSRSNILEEIIVRSSHPITADPISNTNSRIVFTPAASSPYTTTFVELELIDLKVDTSNKFSISMYSISQNGCRVNIKVHMPLTAYFYIVPKVLYEDLTQKFVETQIKSGQFTDGYIRYGILNIVSDLTEYDICEDTLIADTDYIIRLHYKTFTVQNLTPASSASAASTTTTPVAASLEFNPLLRPNITLSASTSTSTGQTTVQRLDQGSIHIAFRTETPDDAASAYLDVTFDRVPSLDQIKTLCCFMAQALTYPLENVWTNEGQRCTSQQLPDDKNYIQNPARVLETESNLEQEGERFLQAQTTASPTVRLNFLRNLRSSQDPSMILDISSKNRVALTQISTEWIARFPTNPPINAVSPLLSMTSADAQFESFANITIAATNDAIRIRRIKLKNLGFVYGVVVESTGKNRGEFGVASYMKIRLGKRLMPTPLLRLLEELENQDSRESQERMFAKLGRKLQTTGQASPVEGAIVKTFTKRITSINDEVDVEIKGLVIDREYEIYYWGASGIGELLMKSTDIIRHSVTLKGSFRTINASSIISMSWAALIVALSWI